MKRNIFGQLIVAFLFTFMGGFCDGYTYMCRNGMFSYMQTGNLIKFCIALANGSFEYCFLIPIVCFCLGCIASVLIGKYKYYTYITLLILIATYVASGFCPNEDIWNIIAVSALSFVGAMQFQAFNKCLSYNYTSTMCTNNMRLFSNSIANKNLRKALFYLAIILCFAVGVVASTLMSKVIGIYTIAPSASIFVIIFILLFINKDNEQSDIEEIDE